MASFNCGLTAVIHSWASFEVRAVKKNFFLREEWQNEAHAELYFVRAVEITTELLTHRLKV